MLLVKVARVGEKIQQVCLNDMATVRNALIAAGRLPFPNEEIWVNHALIGIDAPVYTNDVVILEPRKVNITVAMIRLMDFLVNEDMIDEYHVEDESSYGDDDLDYEFMYNQNREFIDELARLAKEA